MKKRTKKFLRKMHEWKTTKLITCEEFRAGVWFFYSHGSLSGKFLSKFDFFPKYHPTYRQFQNLVLNFLTRTLLTYLKWFDHCRDCSINTALFSFHITSKSLFQFYWISHQHYSINKNMLQYFLEFIISKITLKLSCNIGV